MVQITRTREGQYRIGEASFPDLASAAGFAAAHNIRLSANEYTFAHTLAGMFDLLRSSKLDLRTLLVEVEGITGSESWSAGRKFARVLLDRPRMERS
jgi:hypothetical protein